MKKKKHYETGLIYFSLLIYCFVDKRIYVLGETQILAISNRERIYFNLIGSTEKLCRKVKTHLRAHIFGNGLNFGNGINNPITFMEI